MLIGVKIKKKSVAELGYNGRLKIYVDPKTITSTQAFKSISPKWLGIIGLNFVWSISRTLILIGIKMKKKIVTELGHSERLKKLAEILYEI